MGNLNNSELISRISALSAVEVDIEYAVERLAAYPENVWVFPTNAEFEDFSVFDNLRQHHLVSVITIPRWSGGASRGVRTGFLYRHDLQYDDAH